MTETGGMIDIGSKDVTQRVARARGEIRLTREGFSALQQGTCPKGDVLTTARVAAIQAVKATPTALPMCHPIGLERVEVEFEKDETVPGVWVTVTVAAQAKTGVEMEALHGVTVACLTVYDMLKYTGQAMMIDGISLLEKSGGQGGTYRRQD